MGKLFQETGRRAWRLSASASRTSRVRAKLKAQQKMHQSAVLSRLAPWAATLNAVQVHSSAATRTQSNWDVGRMINGMAVAQGLQGLMARGDGVLSGCVGLILGHSELIRLRIQVLSRE